MKNPRKNDWAALGLAGGECPVGQIEKVTATTYTIRLCEWLMGGLTDDVRVVERTDVLDCALSRWADAVPDPLGWAELVIDTHSLADFQRMWKREWAE